VAFFFLRVHLTIANGDVVYLVLTAVFGTHLKCI